MKVVSFTYELVPETKGYCVNCLDWDCVFTEGETYEQCKKNAEELTLMFLKMLAGGNLSKAQYPKFKQHKTSPYHFRLYFNVDTLKPININKMRNGFTAIHKESELLVA